MSIPNLRPESQTSQVILPSTGTVGDVAATLPYGIYKDSTDFLSGAAEQVAYVYKKLGGDVLDIEIKADNVYANYEEAVLEYSYIINSHQAKNVLSDFLGTTTGSFDHKGELKTSELSSSLSGTTMSLKYPRFEFAYARRVAEGMGVDAGVGGNITEYSASIKTVSGQQDYDLQTIISSAATTGTDAAGNTVPYKGLVGNKRILIKRVYYKTPHAMWRFYGYYGGLNTVGNLSNYGQYADDSTFEVIPTWQNKAQSLAFEDSIYTRNSHYSYELTDNWLRIYPKPVSSSPAYFWVSFSVSTDPWEKNERADDGIDGVNNMNTLPFENIPYKNINSIGKQWIRRFCLSLCKETLGQVRSKFATIPIPGSEVTLNGADLLGQAKEEQENLRTELKELLDELTYGKMMVGDAESVEAVNNIQKKIPLKVFVG
ncbi:MAG: hypothetical protein CMQ51_05560 [Gammaproteobacteria bacterium]|nr:hypothetical protein [Gammaproteobacteria bacterium]